MELLLYIRQTKVFNAQGAEVYIAGGNPQALQVIPGTLPAIRQWKNYNQYIDVTDQVGDLFKLKLTWTLNRDDGGVPVAAVEQKKAASGVITFEGGAYSLLKKWLIDDISAPLNRVDVQIQHKGCGNYTDWSIRATDLIWCEDNVCTFDITLKQAEEATTCIKRTLIADDWQGWFGNTDTPSSGKKHPRFSYCNEIRPNGVLIVIWFLVTLLMPIFTVTAFILATVINSIIAVMVAILTIVKLFSQVTGVGDPQKIQDRIDDLQSKMISFQDIKDIAGNFFVESAGCGREHPAPLIRDYISNVCGKCGVTVNATTAPIFFAQNILIETSVDRQNGAGAQSRYNYHYNACYLGAVSRKGVRRFDDLNIFNGARKNNTNWWIPENAPILTLEEFLNQIKGVYNASWRVVNNTLYFQRKDYWQDSNYAFDFSKTAKDRELLLQGLCFEWDEVKDPVMTKGLYSLDGADTPGNASLAYMNGSVSFGNAELNPNLSGINDITQPIGGTKFRLDGADNDYIMDSMQNVINTSVTSTAIWTGQMFRDVTDYFKKYADYALLVSQETTTLPKIILWDGAYDEGYPMNAKAVRVNSCTPQVAGSSMPSPNLRYNNTPTLAWDAIHVPKTEVGAVGKLNINTIYGFYTVRGVLNGLIYQSPAFLVNYPMFFAPEFEGSLWDWFHWIDDPTFNPVLHQQFTAKLELCCDTLKRIKPFNDSTNIILGQKVKLPTGFYQDGFIKEITISYDTADTYGQYIEIKGRL